MSAERILFVVHRATLVKLAFKAARLPTTHGASNTPKKAG